MIPKGAAVRDQRLAVSARGCRPSSTNREPLFTGHFPQVRSDGSNSRWYSRIANRSVIPAM